MATKKETETKRRTFKAATAKREQVPLWWGIAGPSGSGKTYSALRMATGIASVLGGDVHVLDTEGRRALHYADDFSFKHVDLTAPFGSLDYLEAVKYCVGEGAKVVVIDSASHEHEGEGGYLWTQEAEMDRMAGDDLAKRERIRMAAWKLPSRCRQQMLSGMLQMQVSIIWCFRAKEKVKLAQQGGRMQVIDAGWQPIGGESLWYEMAGTCLLLPRSMGVPTWESENANEQASMKLPKQFADLFPAGRQLDEDLGEQLAKWAKGGGKAKAAAPKEGPKSRASEPQKSTKTHEIPPKGKQPAADDTSAQMADIYADLSDAAAKGTEALKAAWKKVPRDFQEAYKKRLDTQWKPIAEKMDKAKKEDASAF